MHFNVHLEDDRLCTLVMIGVRPGGTKELIAVEDSYRESAESWKTVLGDLKRETVTRFATEYDPKYPNAATTLEKDTDTLLTFFDFPAEHWKHLRTSNVIESPFATVRLRQRVTPTNSSTWRRRDGVDSIAHAHCRSFGRVSSS